MFLSTSRLQVYGSLHTILGARCEATELDRVRLSTRLPKCSLRTRILCNSSQIGVLIVQTHCSRPLCDSTENMYGFGCKTESRRRTEVMAVPGSMLHRPGCIEYTTHAKTRSAGLQACDRVSQWTPCMRLASRMSRFLTIICKSRKPYLL